MKFITSYLVLLFISMLVMAQKALERIDTISPSKHNFSVEVGLHHSLVVNKNYIEPPSENDMDLAYNPYWGFTFYPTTGFQFNLLYDYNFYKNYSVRSGVSVFSRPERYESDSSTIIEMQRKYGIYTFYPDSNIIKYEISPINIEIPLYFGYRINNINIYLGIKIQIASYYKTKSEKINKQENTEMSFEFNSPYYSHLSFYTYIHYNLKLYYLIKNKVQRFKVFIGLDFNDFWRYYYLQAGINIPLWDKK